MLVTKGVSCMWIPGHFSSSVWPGCEAKGFKVPYEWRFNWDYDNCRLRGDAYCA